MAVSQVPRFHVDPSSAAAAGLRTLGWAGLLLPAPGELRLFKIEGDARQGLLVLADRERPRLEVGWGLVERRRFNAEVFLRRKMLKLIKVGGEADIRTVAHATLSPLIYRRDTASDRDLYMGYCPATRRVLQLVYHRDEVAEDRLVEQRTIPEWVDQPADRPQRWAFFGISFVAPAGFVYERATLNVGDMRVHLGAKAGKSHGDRDQRRGRERVVVRHLYPATLALARQPLDKWLPDLVRQIDRTYQPPRRGRSPWSRRTLLYDKLDTPMGPALTGEVRMLWQFRLTRWREPKRMRTWLIHDAAADRLVVIHVLADVAREQAIFEETLAGLNWLPGPG